MTTIGARAVVLGASMGGLLAARALADCYDTVTVVERDTLPDTPVNRRGVPQGRHLHGLLGRGAQILEQFFPGFLDELAAVGVPVVDYSDLSKLSLSFGRAPWWCASGCCQVMSRSSHRAKDLLGAGSGAECSTSRKSTMAWKAMMWWG